jgi:hypothetical protein
MVHFDPAWFEAAGTGIVAAETGVAMWNKKKAASAQAAAPAAPVPVNVTVNTMSAQDWWLGIAIVVAAIIIGALVVHHGLVA